MSKPELQFKYMSHYGHLFFFFKFRIILLLYSLQTIYFGRAEFELCLSLSNLKPVTTIHQFHIYKVLILCNNYTVIMPLLSAYWFESILFLPIFGHQKWLNEFCFYKIMLAVSATQTTFNNHLAKYIYWLKKNNNQKNSPHYKVKRKLHVRNNGYEIDWHLKRWKKHSSKS